MSDKGSLVESLDIAKLAAETAEDKLGRDVVILDLGELSFICDYFVVTSAPTRIQTRDITRAIEEKLDGLKLPQKRQGYREGAWILLDYGVVVVHIFLQAERDFYDLEGLWREAKVVYRSEPNGPRPLSKQAS